MIMMTECCCLLCNIHLEALCSLFVGGNHDENTKKQSSVILLDLLPVTTTSSPLLEAGLAEGKEASTKIQFV